MTAKDYVYVSPFAVYAAHSRLLWVWPHLIPGGRSKARRDEVKLFHAHVRSCTHGPAGRLPLLGVVWAKKDVKMPDPETTTPLPEGLRRYAPPEAAKTEEAK